MCDRLIDQKYVDDFLISWGDDSNPDKTGYMCVEKQNNQKYLLSIRNIVKKNQKVLLSKSCALCYTLDTDKNGLVLKTAGKVLPIFVRTSDIRTRGELRSDSFSTPVEVQTIYNNVKDIILKRVEKGNRQYWFIVINNCHNLPLPIYTRANKDNRRISSKGQMIVRSAKEIASCKECSQNWEWK